jgi:hypothetical protein
LDFYSANIIAISILDSLKKIEIIFQLKPILIFEQKRLKPHIKLVVAASPISTQY